MEDLKLLMGDTGKGRDYVGLDTQTPDFILVPLKFRIEFNPVLTRQMAAE
jgi:hypothetical protein